MGRDHRRLYSLCGAQRPQAGADPRLPIKAQLGGGTIPVLEARATMATVDTARSTAMTARAQRRDFMYMGSPGEEKGQPGETG